MYASVPNERHRDTKDLERMILPTPAKIAILQMTRTPSKNTWQSSLDDRLD